MNSFRCPTPHWPWRRLAAVVVLVTLLLTPGPIHAEARESEPAAQPVAGHEVPHTLADAPPEGLPWFTVTPRGGAIHDVAVLEAEPGQWLFAAGLRLFESGNGGLWQTSDASDVPVLNVATGGGAAYVAESEGAGRLRPSGLRRWRITRPRGDDEVRFLDVSPNHATDGQALAVTVEDWRFYRDDEGSGWSEVIIDRAEEIQVGGAAFSPIYASDDTLFAGTSVGLYRSTDTGQRWELLSEEAPAFGAEVGTIDEQGLVISPEFGDDPERIGDPDDAHIWAYNMNGVFESEDGGVTWTRLPLEANSVADMVVSPGWPRDQSLAVALSDDEGHVAAVSHDGGTSWSKVPGHHGLVGTGIAFAADYALRIPGRPANGIYLPVAYNRAEPGDTGTRGSVQPSGELYLSTDGGGVWRSSDRGETWRPVTSGLASVETTALAMLPGGPNAAVIAGTRTAGLYRSLDGGRRFAPMPSPLPMGVGQVITDIRLSPSFGDDGTIFVAASSGLWRTDDAGDSWETVEGLADVNPAPVAIALSPNFDTDGTLAVPGAMSTDGGGSWSPVAATAEALALAFSAEYAEDSTIFAGTAEALLVSTDAGQTWAEHEDTSLRRRRINDLLTVIVPASLDPMRVFAATDRGVVLSQDAGENWDSAGGTSGDMWTIDGATFTQPAGAVIFATGDTTSLSRNRGADWDTDREAPRDMLAGAISHDGSVLITGGPMHIYRYGVNSGRAFIPWSERR